jgi:hypothetical protein
MKYHLAIAAIFKNENAYLREWIEFHHLVGFDHFYLYDNDGGEEARTLLTEYVEAGLVTRHPWTHFDGTRHDSATRFGGRDKNHMAFGHAAAQHREHCDWLMKIDIDEFLMPTDEETVVPIIDSYDRDKVRGLQLPRVNFGDGGHREKPEGLVIESYTRRELQTSDHKDLANTRFLNNNRFKNSAHSWGYRFLSGGHKILRDEIKGLRINHYYTKSLEESLLRQNMMATRPKTEAQFTEQNQGLNEVVDESMLRFVPELKKRFSPPAV